MEVLSLITKTEKDLLWTECLHNGRIHMLNPNLKWDSISGGAFRRWLGHESGAFMNGIRVLIALMPPVRLQWEDSCLWTKKPNLIRHRSCWHFDSGLLNLQKLWEINVGCLRCPVYVIFVMQPKWTKTSLFYNIMTSAQM